MIINEFFHIISDYLREPKILELDNFIQHCHTTRLLHCVNVSFLTYRECKLHQLNWVQAVDAALLHDFFLYDWRNLENPKQCHAYAHPVAALENARQLMSLSSLQENIILSHMWPLTVCKPSSPEAKVVTKMDKYATAMEFGSIIHDWSIASAIRDRVERITGKIPL